MKVKHADRTLSVQEYYFSQKLKQIDQMRKAAIYESHCVPVQICLKRPKENFLLRCLVNLKSGKRK